MFLRNGSLRVAAFMLPLAVAACDKSAGPENQPIPVLANAEPDTVTVSAAGTDVVLRGESFTRQSRARYNGQERTTVYESGSRLTVRLTAEDLAVAAEGSIEVHNPPPRGGTSRPLTLYVVNPGPMLTSVGPATLLKGDTTSFLVHGANFINGSVVVVAIWALETEFVSSTELRAQMGRYEGPLGTQTIRVQNPPPGGGQSSNLNVEVRHVAAIIETVTPDTIATDATSGVLRVAGRNFFPGATLQWNGSSRPTTVESRTRLSAQLAAGDMRTARDNTVAVANVSAALSNTVSVPVILAPPRIDALLPSTVNAGGPTTTVTVSGRNFTPASVAQWNGQSRTTIYVNPTSLQFSITDADIASASTGMITVREPGTTLTSVPHAFVVLSGAPALLLHQNIVVQNNDVVYDSVSGLFYASVPSGAIQNANAIVAINPTTAAVEVIVSNVGNNPGQLAVSDDGRFLYAGLLGLPRMVRVDLMTRSKDLDFALFNDNFSSFRVVEDILVLQGSPRTVIASLRDLIGGHVGVYAWDDSVRRATYIERRPSSSRITAGPTPSAIYGYDTEYPFAFRRIGVSPRGLQELQMETVLVEGTPYLDITSDGAFAYSTNGDIIDMATMTRVTTVGIRGIVAADAAKGRVHYIDAGATLRTFHANTGTLIGTLYILGSHNGTSMLRWGNDGLALRSGNAITLLRTTLVGP